MRIHESVHPVSYLTGQLSCVGPKSLINTYSPLDLLFIYIIYIFFFMEKCKFICKILKKKWEDLLGTIL